jgi:hypothetical protein
MILPEPLGENLVDQVVRSVLHHLDLFDDDLFLPFNVCGAEGRVQHDVRQDVECQREMLVEDLDVVAGILFRRKRVELPAD